jgi:hypothetical protein
VENNTSGEYNRGMERKSQEQIMLDLILEAYQKGWNVDDPNKQISPTIQIGVKRLKEGQELTTEDIIKIEKMGGTDHPDPWVR